MSQLPEEIEAMAFLIGQSNQIDSMMVERPSTLVTSTQTLKKGLNDYVQQQRSQQPPPTHSYGQQIHTSVPMTPIEPIPNYIPPQPLPQVPQYAPIPQKIDDGQMEFNLEPSKMDEIIILLKEISVKLNKQNSMLEKINANASKKEGVPTPIVKLGTGK